MKSEARSRGGVNAVKKQVQDLTNMKPTPILAIRRNNDGTYSVIDTRAGIRLVKSGFKSHDEAKQWCEDRHLQHGNKDQDVVEH